MALKLWIVSLKNFRKDGNDVLSGTSCQCVYGQAVNLFVFVCCRCLNETGWVFSGFARGTKGKLFPSVKRGGIQFLSLNTRVTKKNPFSGALCCETM